MTEYISREAAVDAGYLSDRYISSVSDESPTWTDAHIDELLNDFIVIPKDTKAADVQSVEHGKWMDAYTWTMFHEFKSSGRGEHFWCSECKQGQKQKSNYCPNCGADMRCDAE